MNKRFPAEVDKVKCMDGPIRKEQKNNMRKYEQQNHLHGRSAYDWVWLYLGSTFGESESFDSIEFPSPLQLPLIGTLTKEEVLQKEDPQGHKRWFMDKF